jgi:hypothetical protein
VNIWLLVVPCSERDRDDSIILLTNFDRKSAQFHIDPPNSKLLQKDQQTSKTSAWPGASPRLFYGNSICF